MAVMFEGVVILAVAVTAFIFLQFSVPAAIALAGGLLVLMAYVHGDGLRFVAAIVLLVAAGVVQLIANAILPPQIAVSPSSNSKPLPPANVEPAPQSRPTPSASVPSPPKAEPSRPSTEEPAGEAPPPGGPTLSTAPRPQRPRLACSRTVHPTNLALCGGVRMVRRGTCPYGWKPLWPGDFAAHSSPACPSPPRPRRRPLDRFRDDGPPFSIPPPPWCDLI
jgi:hypothetical protein